MEHQPVDPALISDVLARACKGDAAAWTTLVRTYGPRVFAVAQSRLHDPDAAEELTQSVFVTVATKLSQGEYREQGRFESWLFRVAMNRVRDVVRRAKRHPDIPLGQESGPAQQVALPNETHLTLRHLREALDMLSPQDREIVELRHHCSMSFQQISDVLNEPMGTLLARHHRALKKLREMLGDPSALGLESGQGDMP